MFGKKPDYRHNLDPIFLISSGAWIQANNENDKLGGTETSRDENHSIHHQARTPMKGRMIQYIRDPWSITVPGFKICKKYDLLNTVPCINQYPSHHVRQVVRER